jgi:hypothetical protein
MKFSDEFNIRRTENDDWFDAILSLDTKLFIDPFLVYESQHAAFADAHQEVITFFNSVFNMIAQSQGRQASLHWQQAVSLLEFPEVEEICLGYTNADTAGSGSGLVLARAMASALWEAVRAGMHEIRHFEEVLLLREGIGGDRISDITASLLRVRLSEYTRTIAQRYNIQLHAVHYRRGVFIPQENRWNSFHTQLPNNPYNNRPILLVPAEFLRSLPTIDAQDFWEYSYSNENETLRREYSQDVTKRVDKETIVSFARRHPEIRSRYVDYREQTGSEPYNYVRDPQGLVKWYDASASFCATNPLQLLIQSNGEFRAAIDQMINEYKLFIEDNEGWRLLWNENQTPKREEAAQLLLLGIVKHYCRANNIDVSREADIGRGPVDFKVALGYQLRALIEVKLAKNSKFWNGLERQLPTYLRAESINLGYFLIVVLAEEDSRRIQPIQTRINAVRHTTGRHIEAVIVDARSNPPSASVL